MNKTKRLLTSSSKISEPKGESGTGGAATCRPSPRGKLDLRRRASLQSNPQDLNMKVQGSQKATQTSGKIKPSGVHMQH